MGILDADGAAGVVAYDMPLLDAELDAQRFDGDGEGIKLAEAAGLAGRAAQTGKIDGNAGEAAAHSVDDSTPKMATCGHAVKEENRVT